MAVEWDYPRPCTVQMRISAEFTDRATAYCLRCGMGRGGFTAEGTGQAVREQVSRHVADTGHEVRFWGAQPVYDFGPAA